jgi:MFS family permease
VAPIRRDRNIHDTQMSLLMGAAFALFSTFFGIPLGRTANSANRRGLITVGFVGWSLFTAGWGLAKNFWQMMLMRIGDGAGEASLSPDASGAALQARAGAERGSAQKLDDEQRLQARAGAERGPTPRRTPSPRSFRLARARSGALAASPL